MVRILAWMDHQGAGDPAHCPRQRAGSAIRDGSDQVLVPVRNAEPLGSYSARVAGVTSPALAMAAVFGSCFGRLNTMSGKAPTC